MHAHLLPGTASRLLIVALLVALAQIVLPYGQCRENRAQPDKPAPKSSGSEKKPTKVEILCMDGSILKLTVLDEKLELVTSFGKLLIPVAEIVQIEFGRRIPEEVAKKIKAAEVNLGSADFKVRSAATADLASAGEWAYAALLEAAKHPDPEVARRAEELLTKLRLAVPAEHLEIRDYDVVHTAKDKINGQLTAPALKVKTSQFGEQLLRLSDIRSLVILTGVKTAAAGSPLADPGSLAAFQGQVGKTLVVRVTGAKPGTGLAWGTDVYTLDSALSVVAVHAGILKPGQTGLMRVTLIGKVQGFLASTKNGIVSSGYGPSAGFRVNR
jgi:hypothetical protein